MLERKIREEIWNKGVIISGFNLGLETSQYAIKLPFSLLFPFQVDQLNVFFCSITLVFPVFFARTMAIEFGDLAN